MARYSDLYPFLKDLSNFQLDTRKPLAEEEIDIIRNNHPGVPEDYLDFLQELGAGLYFDGCFDIHNTLTNAEDICSEKSFMEDKLKGDDALVFALFYDTYYFFVPSKNWAIYGEDHDFSESYHVSDESFEIFIRRVIANNRG